MFESRAATNDNFHHWLTCWLCFLWIAWLIKCQINSENVHLSLPKSEVTQLNVLNIQFTMIQNIWEAAIREMFGDFGEFFVSRLNDYSMQLYLSTNAAGLKWKNWWRASNIKQAETARCSSFELVDQTRAKTSVNNGLTFNRCEKLLLQKHNNERHFYFSVPPMWQMASWS